MKSDTDSIHEVVLPVRIGIDPMERLLVASFKGDPEFLMLEPQIFDDPVNGKGMRVLRYRKDQKVDVYWQPGVVADRSTIAIGAGIGDFVETTIEPARFEITGHGVDVHFAFIDAQDRKVELRIVENPAKRSRFPFLAPVGKDIENPQRLFFANMLEFDFVRRKGTEVFAQIGKRTLYPESFPVLRNYQRVLFIRYSAMPVIGTFNPPMNKPLAFALALPGSIEIEGMKVIADENSKITQISVGEKPRRVEVDFRPGFPNILDLPGAATETGRWTFRVSEGVMTGGTYAVSRDGDSVTVDIDATENWKPSGLPLSFRIFTGLVRSFRSWPSTYRWRGTVDLSKEPTLVGAWERKGRGT